MTIVNRSASCFAVLVDRPIGNPGGAEMVKHSARPLLVILALLIFGGCKPTLSYRNADNENPASPPDNVLVFSLRTSDILLDSQKKSTNVSGKDAGKNTTDSSPVDVCMHTAEPHHQDSVPAPTKRSVLDSHYQTRAHEENQTGVVNQNHVPSKEEVITECMRQITISARPGREKQHVFYGIPNAGTSITATAVDTDPLMVKSIGINYKSPAVGMVNSAGAGAVTGFAVGGPWGAAVGAGLGVIGSTITSFGFAGKTWGEVICEKDFVTPTREAIEAFKENEPAPELLLPLVLEYKDASDCWHPFPSSGKIPAKGRATGRVSLNGWFYRIQPVKDDKLSDSIIPPVASQTNVTQMTSGDNKPSVFMKREDYFKNTSGEKETESKDTFPVSACREIEVQFAWWETVRGDSPVIAHLKLMVADSNYIQPVRIPKAGSIFLLPICGGFASPTVASSASSELIDALVKQAQTVKDAQTKYQSAQQKK